MQAPTKTPLSIAEALGTITVTCCALAFWQITPLVLGLLVPFLVFGLPARLSSQRPAGWIIGAFFGVVFMGSTLLVSYLSLASVMSVKLTLWLLVLSFVVGMVASVWGGRLSIVRTAA